MINAEHAEILYDEEKRNFLNTFSEKCPETVALIETEIKSAVSELKREASIWLINTSIYATPFDELESKNTEYVGERLVMFLRHWGYKANIVYDERENASCVRFWW